MAMVVSNNSSAQMALGELRKNNSKLDKAAKQAASGVKINDAGDGASEYSISEKMRVRIRGLEQDERNVQTGINLLKTAEAGIQQIIEEIRSLWELSINSANDHNSDIDRATLQREFDHRRANIDEIASETNYNGKILLDGRYRPPKVEIPKGGTEPSGVTVLIPTGNYTIANDGVYILDTNYSGTVTINAKNVEIRQASTNALSDVYIVGPANGGANLWIDGLNIKNSSDKNIIRFEGSDNTLTLKGNTTFSNKPTIQHQAWYSSIIHMGNGLTVEGTAGSYLTVEAAVDGAIIGTDGFGMVYNGDLTINNLNASLSNHFPNLVNNYGATIGTGVASNGVIDHLRINGGNITAIGSDYGAGIGTGEHGKVNHIEINQATIKAQGGAGAAIGCGDGNSTVGDITIQDSIVGAIGWFGAGIGGGCTTINDVDENHVGNITLTNSIITASADDAAAIGSGYKSTAQGITIIGSTINATTTSGSKKTGAAIGTGEEGIAGAIHIDDASSIQATSGLGENIGRGVNGSLTGVIDYNGLGNGPGADLEIPTDEITEYLPLVIQHGTKANEALNVYINDMHTKSLKSGGKSLADASIITRPNAVASLSILDGALNYALNEVTNIGAYISRLEHTEANIVTANESTQASESTIRDADMAKTMMEHAKYNILTQSAQSMLAQSNQNSSNVLNLLQ